MRTAIYLLIVISKQIIMNTKHLEEVKNLKYLRATMSKDGLSTVEVKNRLAMAIPSLSRLFRILRISDISLSSKLIHYEFVVLTPHLYKCGN